MFANKAGEMALNFNTNMFLNITALLLTVSILASCATSQNETTMGEMANNTGAIYDPLEESNRATFAFNQTMDDIIIMPVVKGYETALPEPARDGIDNVLRNLRSPTTLANQLLQGDIKGAGNVVLRAAINTFVGLGGLFDVAGREGIPYEYEDFGQTLATWGVGHGPYIVVPLIGPSSMRDYAGYFIDSYADPLRWYLFNTHNEGIYYGKVGVEYIALRSSLVDVLEDLEKSSIDYYAATRSTYYQRREALVNDLNGQDADTAINIPDYDDF